MSVGLSEISHGLIVSGDNHVPFPAQLQMALFLEFILHRQRGCEGMPDFISVSGTDQLSSWSQTSLVIHSGHML